ncbi:MAG: hypothetical protein WB762_05860 [Candidatus Sulfotelmatobacter sp.]
MKAKVIIAFLISIVTASSPAFSTAPGKIHDDGPPHVASVSASPENAHLLADIVAVPPASPRAPQLSVELEVISNAVATGQITREQGEYASGERYEVATMQFQLFGALHTMLEADIARTPVVPEPAPSVNAETVVVAMPFSSLQLNPSLVKYLGLNPSQVRSIQSLMDQQRPSTEPLMLELRTISAELGFAIAQSRSNDAEGAAQRLAATHKSSSS